MTARLITASVFLSAMAACGGAPPAARPAAAEPAPPASVIVVGEPGTGDEPAAAATEAPRATTESTGADDASCATWREVTPVDEQDAEDAYAAGITELEPTLDGERRRLSPALVLAVLDRLDGWPARGARIVPSIKKGVPNGVKLYAIKATSVYARLGFANGDTLHTLNGVPVSADTARCTLLGLRGASTIEARLTRRGKPLTLRFEVR
jgi:hypothetical protein